MQVDDFDYELPERLIAQVPLADRTASRLMVIDPVQQEVQHSHFYEIKRFLKPGDVLVLNNSKVLPARLYAIKQDTGAEVELLLLHPTTDGLTWTAMAKPAKRLKVGTVLTFIERGQATVTQAAGIDISQADRPDGPTAVVTRVLEEGLREIQFHVDEPFEEFLNRMGTMPLPPYIHATLKDRTRYQTVYAKPLGSVAAPTAGLHFTPELLAGLRDFGVEIRFVTLHVGIGTFRTVQVDTVESHQMHTEWYEIDEETAGAVRQAKREGRRVIAVGTTALRTLESASVSGECVAQSEDTGIFIYPGYQFRTVDALITNFHLPKSTLFMLVSAWMGLDFAKKVYNTAVELEYRFFSFGDAMFLTRRNDRP